MSQPFPTFLKLTPKIKRIAVIISIILFGGLIYGIFLLQYTHQISGYIDFDRVHIKYIYPEVISLLNNKLDKKNDVDWSSFAYIFYATDYTSVCNSIMLIHQLKGFKSKAQFLLLANTQILDPKVYGEDYENLIKFSDSYDVKIKPVDVTINDEGSYWEASFTKLEIFNQFDYERLIYLDTDSILPNGNLDELFFIPPAKLATVTAYWLTEGLLKKSKTDYHNSERVLDSDDRMANVQKVLDIIENYKGELPLGNKNKEQEYLRNQKTFFNTLYNSLPNYESLDEFFFSSILMVITPSMDIKKRMIDSYKARKKHDFDMDMLNRYIFHPRLILSEQQSRNVKNDIPDLLLLPHRVYGCLTGQLNFESKHDSFLADPQDQPYIGSTSSKKPYYDVSDIPEPSKEWLPNVKYMHFSDAPLPKPWNWKDPNADYMKHKKRCPNDPFFKDITIHSDLTTTDCNAGKMWEKFHETFAQLRKNICHHDLVGDPKKNKP